MTDTESESVRSNATNWKSLYTGAVGYRVLTMVARFAIALYITKVLSIGDLGIYGLVLASVVVLTYVIGFEYHTYSTRRVIQQVDERPTILKTQLAFHVCTYFVAAPFVGLLFWTEIIPVALAPAFVAVLIGTHASQEVSRLLIGLERVSAAYRTTFLSHGLWVFVVMGLAIWVPESRSLTTVLWSWAAFSFGGAVAGLREVRSLVGPSEDASVDWTAMRDGARLAFPLFVAAFCLRTIDYADRYFLDFWFGQDVVGVYSFVSSMARPLPELIAVSVAAVLFPRLVSTFRTNDRGSFLALRRVMFRRALLFSAGLSVLLLIAGLLVVQVDGYEEIRSGLVAFSILLLTGIVMNASLMAHYTLYSVGRDRTLVLAAVLGALSNLAMNFVLVPQFGLNGAAVATLFAFVVVWGVLTRANMSWEAEYGAR